MDKRIVIEFTNGRGFDNLVVATSGRPEDEVLAEIQRANTLMEGRGFKMTGTRTFQEWTPYGWVRMSEEQVHEQPARIVGGFRTRSAFLHG